MTGRMSGSITDVTHLRATADAPARERHRSVRPADAASLIVVDRSGPSPRLLMGRRHAGHRFMPNAVVFPGGRVDPDDRRMVAFGALPTPTERQLLARTVRGTAARARALALCAIRETCEETGLLIGEAGLGGPDEAPATWQPFVTEGVYPSLEVMRFFARAITPPGRTKRFDARFFAVDAEAITMRIDVGVGPQSELTELMWLTPDEALADHTAVVTKTIITELVARLEAGLDRDLPVPLFYERHGRWLREEIP